MTEFDFVVIGGGSAGFSAASEGAKLGLRTMCADGGPEVGGLCILRGCMPSKTLIESANRFLTLRRAQEFGLRAGHLGFDSGAIRHRKRTLISGFADHRRDQLENWNFDFVPAQASFISPRPLMLEVPDGLLPE